jgi:transcriptional regulator with XRE-family HTH domain
MTVSLKAMMDKLPPARRQAVEQRAAALIAEEMALRKLREAFALTQENVAKSMSVGQETVSRIERQQKDLRLSTLRKYIAALGGDLELVARFPDKSVKLLDLGAIKPLAKRRTIITSKPKASKKAA